MIISQIQGNHPAGPKYSAVVSWILDYDGSEIDERTHGFIFNLCLTLDQRATIISEFLRDRMWCDIDSEYTSQDEFDLDEYDSIHYVQ